MTNATSNVIWTAAEAAKATGGQAAKEWAATSLSIDTRTLERGALFIALEGEHSDGHNYVAQALEKGAAAALVSRVPDDVPEDAPLLLVDDTLAALRALGCAARDRSGTKIIAVTGSVGKTGTKEMLALAFGALGQTHASRASYNNHWGVPFTLGNMHAGADYGIFEVGMNHVGEITPLTKMVRPDIAIITTIAPVHMEHFDSLEQIADAKAEIFEGIVPGGTAVLNHDNEFFAHLKAKAEDKGVQVRSFGESAEADARLLDCLEAANGSRVKAQIIDEDVSFTLPVPGRHIVQNVLAVLLAVKLAGGDVAKAARALEKYEGVAGRGKREYLDIGDPENPVMLIDESYNASPVAMKAAFKVLALIDPGRGGRRIAVLGDMYELGKQAPQLHADLALPLEAADVQLVYTCGPLMKNLYDALPQDRRGAHSDDSVELAKIVPDVLTPGDVVMVKGSRGGGEKPRMQIIVEALRALPGRKSGKAVNKEEVDAL
ncbi:MAG: UDP-N-acetylmuramoylalanyl-D-glutamyl-2,6-diaminopimelate--D-alanyl-D-alanine ligase [Rhodospirillales bacterium]|nr:UDP-N-acetylmuramoylalanyl-D-glutamyl-2,6-diaminopimelate--D-alanyl-D-alanine ligase [Rhodospirillales bacterium]MCB9996699.1 UDP-N-acetylmuramoylalanyl-D-glutamyl-2,6-diaminopimelate--D-alanyl-D-alanine ligase [Rhodospirillales bacterium]